MSDAQNQQDPLMQQQANVQEAGAASAGESALIITPASASPVAEVAEVRDAAAANSMALSDEPEVVRLGEDGSPLAEGFTEAGALTATANTGSEPESDARDIGSSKTPHHSALEELVGAIRRTFNILGGDLEAAVRKAEELL